ncbi:hypothetical protein ACIF9R_19250 [Streptomyces sp. NPDC086080]|uniref:hypothetical protein n=1 Tax=Streptomyces sp. NPDC086080 TaxID=3365748 RepID=UPI0037D537BC
MGPRPRWALEVAPANAVAFEDSATSVATARTAGLHVAVAPSLPGPRLDHDRPGASLDEPELVAWARASGRVLGTSTPRRCRVPAERSGSSAQALSAGLTDNDQRGEVNGS